MNNFFGLCRIVLIADEFRNAYRKKEHLRIITANNFRNGEYVAYPDSHLDNCSEFACCCIQHTLTDIIQSAFVFDKLGFRICYFFNATKQPTLLIESPSIENRIGDVYCDQLHTIHCLL
ncbi:hypothetical protein BCF11_1172 [Collimonas sp. PA-H2]|nr:hypothetical protein BCF11_1172 [Collimonas sp. PA-H2]